MLLYVIPPGDFQHWRGVEEMMRADAIAAFGSAPRTILGVVFAADSDNTGESAESYFAAPQVRRAP